MSNSIREQIVQNVEAVLQAISIDAGYNNTLASVQRRNQGGLTRVDVPVAYISEGTEEVNDGPMGSVLLVSRKLQLGILLLGRQEDLGDIRSIDEYMGSLRADVQKALMADPTRGGLAINTTELNNQSLDPDEGIPELNTLVLFEIYYRHLRSDPGSLT